MGCQFPHWQDTIVCQISAPGATLPCQFPGGRPPSPPIPETIDRCINNLLAFVMIKFKVVQTQTKPFRVTYGKGPEYYVLKLTFCPLLEMLTYFLIKFDLITGIKK